MWTVGSPGTASKAISVGASTPTMKVPYIQIGHEQIRLTPLFGSVEWKLAHSYELADGGMGKKRTTQRSEGKDCFD